jgi:copper chaperone CopZ
MQELLVRVPGMTCDHCVAAISGEISRVPGVTWVDVDLASKNVAVHGRDLDPTAVRDAVVDAGYEPEA